MALKALTFRVIILVADGVVVYAITRELKLALTVMLIRNAVGMLLYFFHEEYWNRIKWGYKKSNKKPNK